MYLTLLALLLSMQGCVTVGVKKETKIVHSSFVAYDMRLNSVMAVATNKPIPVTLGDEVYTEKDVAGYILVHPTEASYFLDLLEADQKRLSEEANE